MILIIGAGISGLTLAYELQKRGIEYKIVESGTQAGGCMKSKYKDNYLLELGPNTVLADPDLKSFFNELKMNGQMLIPSSESRKRYVLKNGQLKQLPAGPLSFLFGNFFSWDTKRAIFRERNLRNTGKEQETIGEFFERRFNKELVDYAVAPFVSGIFAGDPYRLLIDKTLPFLPQLERKYGSVVKGFMKSKRNKKDSVIFKYGFGELINSLTAAISPISYCTTVESVSKDVEGFTVRLNQYGEIRNITADRIVITTPSYTTAGILKAYNPVLSGQIGKINYCPMVKVFAGFKKKDIKAAPSGYGVLNPACENQFSIGTIFNSSLNGNSAPHDRYLFTTMVGGVNHECKTTEPDNAIAEKVVNELRRIYGISADPDFTYVHKIANAIPQYDNNMVGLEAVVESLADDGIYICSNWYMGAAISDCIRKARRLAENIQQCPSCI